MAAELRSDSRMGVRPTRVFLSETVLDTTNCAYSQAACRRSKGVLFSSVQEPASW